MSDKIKGTVKWFNETKGFGFVESGGQDYFAHFKSINSDGFKTLNEGAAVSFTPSKGAKGLQAESIDVI